ncbi:TadE-like protein [mine drainage metagenome]|uniref:TadE-like protein n=1 Tax=mine drainage metagenome TaxID=410659 RepID=A0A1J5QH82_9ZZZZ
MTTTTPRSQALSARARRRARRARRDAGSVSVEIAILFPVLLALIVGIVQYGLWFHASSLALAAAQEGVSAARVYSADPGSGPARAREFLVTHGAGTLTDVTVAATTPGAGQVEVQVTGRSLSLVPGVPGLVVTQSAAGPVERFTTPGAP